LFSCSREHADRPGFYCGLKAGGSGALDHSGFRSWGDDDASERARDPHSSPTPPGAWISALFRFCWRVPSVDHCFQEGDEIRFPLPQGNGWSCGARLIATSRTICARLLPCMRGLHTNRAHERTSRLAEGPDLGAAAMSVALRQGRIRIGRLYSPLLFRAFRKAWHSGHVNTEALSPCSWRKASAGDVAFALSNPSAGRGGVVPANTLLESETFFAVAEIRAHRGGDGKSH